jgi:hypothetical protein
LKSFEFEFVDVNSTEISEKPLNVPGLDIGYISELLKYVSASRKIGVVSITSP